MYMCVFPHNFTQFLETKLAKGNKELSNLASNIAVSFSRSFAAATERTTSLPPQL
jgi:hypothetical protein